MAEFWCDICCHFFQSLRLICCSFYRCHIIVDIDIARGWCNGKANLNFKGPKMNMKRASTLAFLAGLAVLAQGCTQLRARQGYLGDATLLSSVQPGVDNKESVEASLGRPTFTGQFGDSDWYYFARDTKQLAFNSPKPTSQFVLHIQFDAAGNVVAAKQSGMENIARITPESDKTPTLGRNTSFFEELFGNVGSVGAGGAPGGGGGPN
jgi:outer membrane protein assembly factor BamE (lipoprotein component of BamABCDE complex)